MIVYSLSDVGSMVRDCIKSIKSIRKISKIPIRVYVTPPYPGIYWCRGLKIEVTMRENQTEPINIGHRKGRYLEKLAAITSCSEEKFVFLDCDTRVYQDPAKLFEGEFDFSGRIAPSNLFNDWNIYGSIFPDNVIPVFNAGCLVFKNDAGAFIGDLALNLIRDIPRFNPQNQLDQVLLTMAVSYAGLRIKYMTKKDHGFRWMRDPHDCIVYHGSIKNPVKEVLRDLRRVYRYVS